MSDQITDKAIFYIDRQKKIDPNKPFFLDYAPGATHAPHQVDRYWSDQYKGKFDKGWDSYRDEVFERQEKLGVIPANAKLPDRNPDIKAWDSLTPEEKNLRTLHGSLCRLPGVYGFRSWAPDQSPQRDSSTG